MNFSSVVVGELLQAHLDVVVISKNEILIFLGHVENRPDYGRVLTTHGIWVFPILFLQKCKLS